MSLGRLPSLVSVVSFCRPIHTCVPLSAGQKWRMRQGKSRTGNEYGPLTDLPDWTYTDGRPPVLGKGQLRRKVKQFALSQRIRRLLDEMDSAKTQSGGDQVDEEEVEEVEGDSILDDGEMSTTEEEEPDQRQRGTRKSES